MCKFVRVASVSEILPGQGRAYIVGDREVAVFNVDGAYHAIENGCPHQGGPLAEGRLDGRIVTCPWHAWCFDVTDGKMTMGFTSVDAFDVQVEGSTISVSADPRT